MKYTAKDYEVLGKMVAAGKYVRLSTLVLAVLLAAVLGAVAGYMAGTPASGSGATRVPLGQQGPSGALDPARQQLESILQHELDVQKDPENLEAWVHLGNLYYDAKEPAKAIRAYEKALALQPDAPDVLVDCGVMYRAIGQYDRAVEYFDRALSLRPEHEFALFNRGVVLYFDLDRKPEALDSWREVVRINPGAKAPNNVPVSEMIKSLEQ